MFDKRCAICGDMVGPYGDGKWLHVANQYPDPPHEVVLAGHMQRCGAGQGGMFCICDSLQDERNAGLDAARDAVAAVPSVDDYTRTKAWIDRDAALAAIDAAARGAKR